MRRRPFTIKCSYNNILLALFICARNQQTDRPIDRQTGINIFYTTRDSWHIQGWKILFVSFFCKPYKPIVNGQRDRHSLWLIMTSWLCWKGRSICSSHQIPHLLHKIMENTNQCWKYYFNSTILLPIVQESDVFEVRASCHPYFAIILSLRNGKG